MAFTTFQSVLDAMPGQPIRYSKTVTLSTGNYLCTWSAAGFPPAGADPSSGLSGDIPTAATTGALPLTNAASGGLNVARLHVASQSATNTVGVMLYDRLWHNSGINVTSTSPQTITSTALNRPDSTGANVEVWWQTYVVMGAGTPQITLAYTDQDGNSGNTALSGVLATALPINRTGPFTLAQGDTGVRSIQTYTADASFTSGTIGLVLRRKVLDVTILDPDVVLDVLRSVLAPIPSNACLEFVVGSTANTTGAIQGELMIVQG